MRFNSLVDTKSCSVIRIDPHSKRHPRHSDVVRHLLSKYPSTKPIAKPFLERLSPANITSLMSVYQDDLVSPERKSLLMRLFQRKTDILRALVMES